MLIRSVLTDEFSIFEKDTINFLLMVTTDIKRRCLEEFCTYVDIEAKHYLCEICGILYPDNQLHCLNIEDYHY